MLQKNKNRYMLLTIFIVGAMLLSSSISSSVSFAAVDGAQEQTTVYGFSDLGDAAKQTAKLGTKEEALNLPKTLTATVSQAEDTPIAALAVTATGSSETEVEIPVLNWTASPRYDMNTAQTYTFTPEFDDQYIIDKSVDIPTITVTLEDDEKDNDQGDNDKGDADKTVDSFAELQDAIANIDGSGAINISGSFDVTQTVTIPSKKKITITSDGGPHTLKRGPELTKKLFQVNGTLILSNIIMDGGGESQKSASPIISNQGKLTLQSKSRLQNNHSKDSGGAVYNSGKMSIQGGLVTKNHSIDGGAIYNVTPGGDYGPPASLTMTSGTISYNTSGDFGGGISCSNATFHLKGGNINHNTAREGGGLHISGEYNDALQMTGGTISQNSSKTDGGGIYIEGALGSELSGGKIFGNKAAKNGRGIYLSGDGCLGLSGSIRMTGNNGYYLSSCMETSRNKYELICFATFYKLSKNARIQIEGFTSYASMPAAVAEISKGKISDADFAKFHSVNGNFTLGFNQKHTQVIAIPRGSSKTGNNYGYGGKGNGYGYGNGSGNSHTPGTGDMSNINTWIGLGILSLIAIAVVLRKKLGGTTD